MKRSKTARIFPVFALAVAAALMAPAAFAKDHGHRDRDGRGDHRSGSTYRDDDRDGRYRNEHREGRYRDDDRKHGGKHGGKHDRHHRDRVVYVAPRYSPPPRVVYRPAPPRHANYPRWSRGARYYDRGYAPTYVVNDYYGYGLRQPPRGHHWRRDDRGDFLLVAIATGIIAEVLFH